MSASVNYYTNGSIGKMFARQNVPSVYGRQRQPGEAEQQEAAERVDRVSLSAQAPKPLSADFLEDALDAGDAMAAGDTLSGENSERLRLDRVFAAVAALELLGENGGQAVTWPGGLPAPSQAELEAARRRLAQRPQNTEAAENPAAVQSRRIDLLEKITKRDFGQVTFTGSGTMSPAVPESLPA